MRLRNRKEVWFAIIILIVAVVMFFSRSASNNFDDKKSKAIESCISKCLSASDLSNGSCLSNEIVSGWVCDVAHNPRQPIDDNPENQCSEYGKSAKHFVEVNEKCELIRAV